MSGSTVLTFFKHWIPTLFRVFFGFILLMAGWRWLTHSSLTIFDQALTRPIESGTTFGFYAAFLTGVVLPNAPVFKLLVGLGEFCVGASLMLGAATRLSLGVIGFMFLNYGLLNGWIGLVGHLVMWLMIAATVLTGSPRRHGLDRWLYDKWPNAKIW